MNIKSVILVSIFLLAVMMLGTVSAADDADNLTVSDDVGDIIDAPASEMDIVAEDEDEFGDDDKMDPEGFYGHVIDHYQSYPIKCKVFSDSDLTGNISISVEGTEYVNEKFVNEKEYVLDTSKLPEGFYSIAFAYLGDDSYNPYTYDDEFDIYGLYETPESGSLNKGEWVYTSLPEDAEGSLDVYLNGTKIGTYSVAEDGDQTCGFYLKNATCGVYNFTVVYSGDKKYHSTSKSEIIKIDYLFVIYPQDYYDTGELVFGDENCLDIFVPDDIDWNKITVTINGKKYPVVHSGDDHFINLTDFKAGKYNAVMSYAGDDAYPKATSNNTFSIIYKPTMSNVIYYGDDENITFNLKDAKGDFVVKMNGAQFAKVKFTNGVAVVPLNSLAPGEYEVECSYVGNDYSDVSPMTSDLRVYAKFITPEYLSTIADNINVTLIMPKDATGKLIVCSHDSDDVWEAPLIDGVAVAFLDLKMNSYRSFDAYYSEGDGDFFQTEFGFYVSPIVADWTRNLGYDESANFIMEMPKDAKGNFIIYLNEELKYNKTLTNGVANVTYDDLEPGDYEVIIVYEGDDYGYWDESGNMVVGPKVTCPERIDVGESNYIKIELPNYKGKLSYVAYSESNPIEHISKTLSFDSVANISLPSSTKGMVTVEYALTSEDGPMFEDMRYIKIMGDPVIRVNVSDIHEDEDAVIEIGISSAGFDSKFSLTVSNKTTTYSFDDEITKKVTLSDLKAGKYDVLIQCTKGTFTNPMNATYTFNVLAKLQEPDIIVSNVNAYYGDNILLQALINPNATGNIIFRINNTDYPAPIVNGVASVNIQPLDKRTYEFTVTYDGNDMVRAGTAVGNVTITELLPPVIFEPKIVAKDVVALYTNKASFPVTVYFNNESISAETPVTFKINGKQVKVINTTEDGKATLTLSKQPGTYKVTVEALGIAVTKKVTVKHILTLKTIKVKKSAKKLVLTATLKKGRALLKNKKVTFKFAGKKYTAKTNKKGVAKYTIKKSVLKKLKVGKKVTYQATYMKDTIKKTAKVKK